jgi:predicted lipoprotein with Yx(FWY)xxD motif
MKRPLPLAIGAVLVAVSLTVGLSAVLAASDSQSNGRTGTVATASSPLGTILVDRRGSTLYLFEKDRRGESACSGACALEWPPLITRGKPTAAGTAQGSLLGTTRRGDGSRQVTYRGHPLYRFAGDTRPGQTAGQGLRDFGAGWFVVSPAGATVDRDSASQPSQPRYGGQSPDRPLGRGY